MVKVENWNNMTGRLRTNTHEQWHNDFVRAYSTHTGPTLSVNSPHWRCTSHACRPTKYSYTLRYSMWNMKQHEASQASEGSDLSRQPSDGSRLVFSISFFCLRHLWTDSPSIWLIQTFKLTVLCLNGSDHNRNISSAHKWIHSNVICMSRLKYAEFPFQLHKLSTNGIESSFWLSTYTLVTHMRLLCVRASVSPVYVYVSLCCVMLMMLDGNEKIMKHQTHAHDSYYHLLACANAFRKTGHISTHSQRTIERESEREREREIQESKTQN